MKSCSRCSKEIPAGTVYRMVSYKISCPACSLEVFGESWALGKYSDICCDGSQVEWYQRKQWVLGGSRVPSPAIPVSQR
jgi:hypothetical protein